MPRIARPGWLTLPAALALVPALALAQASPEQLYGDLFRAVQTAHVFADGKTFADAVARRAPAQIMAAYDRERPAGAAALRAFVLANFAVPGVNDDDAAALRTHIRELWPVLTRRPAEPPPGSSQLPVAHRFVVPGGRFREMYYWDSYFTMLGLRVDGEQPLVEAMIADFTDAIERYGHVPNGMRTYYLSRSQPPFYALMLDLSDGGRGRPPLPAMLPHPVFHPAAMVPAFAPWLDLAGLAVFAASGALAAAQRGQTMVTLAFFALVTGVGGGTVRDLLIGAPVFWVHDARAAGVCLAVALLIWVTPARWWRGQALDWFDAIGLAAYAVYGAAKALRYGIPPVPAALMGVVTACVGGIIRDVLAGEPSILMRPELYVTAAALAAGSHVALVEAGMPVPVAAAIAAAAGFGLRAAAIRWRLALPGYRARRSR